MFPKFWEGYRGLSSGASFFRLVITTVTFNFVLYCMLINILFEKVKVRHSVCFQHNGPPHIPVPTEHTLTCICVRPCSGCEVCRRHWFLWAKCCCQGAIQPMRTSALLHLVSVGKTQTHAHKQTKLERSFTALNDCLIVPNCSRLLKSEHGCNAIAIS